MKMYPSKMVDSAGSELVIRVLPGTVVPVSKVVGIEVYGEGQRLVLEVDQEWINDTVVRDEYRL
jgi:hypothetical protein